MTDQRQDANAASDTKPTRRSGGPIRRLYEWVMGWAETPYGSPALFLIAFAESSVFPIPPDVLQIALSVSKPRRAYYYATISALGSISGAVLGWAIGYAFWSLCQTFFYDFVPGVTEESVAHVGSLYREHAFWSIFAAAFTPIPFKVFTIAAGVFHEYVSLQTLLIASALGRTARFMLVATMIFFFGSSVRQFLETRLEIATMALFVLLIGGFVAVKFLLH